MDVRDLATSSKPKRPAAALSLAAAVLALAGGAWWLRTRTPATARPAASAPPAPAAPLPAAPPSPEEARLRESLRADPKNYRLHLALARQLLSGRRFLDALDAAREAQRLSPGSVSVQETLAQCLLASARRGEAAQILRRLAPSSPSARVDLASCLAADGDRPGALKELAALKDVPPDLALPAARVWMNCLRPEAALPLLRKSTDPTASTYLGTALLILGRPAEAAAPLRQAREGGRETPAGLFYLGSALRLSRPSAPPEEARGSLERAASGDPGNPRFALELALCQEALGQTDTALRTLEAAAADPAAPAEVYDALAAAYTRAGRSADAEVARARSLMARDDAAAAVRLLQPLRRKDPAQVPVALTLSRALREADRAAEALALLESPGLPADHVDLLWERVRAYRALQKNDEALQTLARMESLAPDDLRVLDERADILQPLARYDEVEQTLIALRDRDASNAFRHYQLGLFYVLWSRRADRNAEAEKHFREALRLSPNFIGPQYRLAVLQQNTGRAADAIPVLRRLADAQPEFTEGLQALGRAYTLAGERERGAELLAAARRLEAREREKKPLERKVLEGRATPADRLALANLLLRGNDLEGATRELERYCHFQPADAGSRSLLITLLGYARRYERQRQLRAGAAP